MYKRIMGIVLTMIMFLNPLASEIIMATEMKAISAERTNYNFINTSDFDNIQYTYEENGKTYAVHERMNVSFTECHTEIYVINDGTEVLVEEFYTLLEKNNSIINIKKYNDDGILEERCLNINGNSTTLSTGRPYDGMIYYEARTNRYFTGWYYDHTHSSSTIFAKLTYSAVAVALAGIVGYYTGSSVVSDTIQMIAQTIIEMNIPIVYWSQDVYLVNQIRYPERTIYGSFVGQRIYVDFYSDSARTSYLGSEMYEWHDPQEWPLLTIGPA